MFIPALTEVSKPLFSRCIQIEEEHVQHFNDNGKHEDLSRKKLPARCFLSSRDYSMLRFCGFILHLIGREAINIPEIFSGVHGFTAKTVTVKCRKKIMLAQV